MGSIWEAVVSHSLLVAQQVSDLSAIFTKCVDGCASEPLYLYCPFSIVNILCFLERGLLNF